MTERCKVQFEEKWKGRGWTISHQLSEKDINDEKQKLTKEVEVIVERKVYVEIPTEVIKKVEVIREVFVDGAVRGPFPTVTVCCTSPVRTARIWNQSCLGRPVSVFKYYWGP